MASRTMWTSAGLMLLGIVLLAIGALIEPARTAANPISESGESLIALGLTFILVGLGFFLASGSPTE